MRIIPAGALLFFLSFSCLAQTVLENNPAAAWYQVNTPHFRVLYMRGFEQQAQRVANSLEHIRMAEARSLSTAPRRISVVLQNQSAISNGFVSLLPRRSEFFGMPSQNYNLSGTNDWLDMLTAHEYRHIVQYHHATRGFNRLIYYLFGSISLAGMSQAAAPPWFWEGDAVAAETAFTPSGRGKIPNFGLLLRTNFLEGRTFNYHKQSLRSFRHNIPDRYEFGYYMVSYLRKKTNDPEIWSRITGRSWSVPFIPFAFSNALKKETGMYVTGLYRDMARELTQQWKQELDGLSLTPFRTVNRRSGNAYTDYLYPQPLADGRVVVMKKGIGDIEQFVVLDNGDEKVFTPGMVNETGMLSSGNNTLVWNEYGFDPRWRMRSYSLVKSFDLSAGRKRVIGPRRSRYAGAAISPRGDKVVTVQTGTDYRTNLVILDVASGAVDRMVPNPGNHFLSMPRWSDDGKKIAFLKTVADGRTVSVLDTETGTAADVLPVTQENIGHPVLHGRYLLFNSPASGIDNIYAVDLVNRERFQITSSRLGAYNPAVSPDGKLLFYNDQSRNGLDVVSIPFEPASWRPYTPGRVQSLFFQHLVEQEGHPDILSDVPADTLIPSRYRKIQGIINPFNWGFAVESDLTVASIGLMSRDVLSTTEVSLGYEYDISERTTALKGRVSYQGWYPIVDVTASLSNREVNEGVRRFYDTLVNPVASDDREVILRWKEKNIQAGLRLPLLTTTSRYHSEISLGNAVGLTRVSGFENNIDKGGRFVPSGSKGVYPFFDYADNGDLVYNTAKLSAHRLLKQSRRDINSKWGQQLSVTSFETPFGGDFDGRLLSVVAVLYFPGLAKHHSFWTYGAYQHSKFELTRQTYLFRNQVPIPRGQSVSRFRDFYSVSANYALPVWYPDIAAGPFLNIQRLRANLFADYALGEGPDFMRTNAVDYTSVGIEAKLDLNILRFLPRLDLGVRYTRGLRPETSEFEVLVGSFNF